MGVHFAPCYANLFMGFWEGFHIWFQNPFARHLVYYRRYIDNVLIIWDGSLDAFGESASYSNSNQFVIKFTHVVDAKYLFFLVFINGRKIYLTASILGCAEFVTTQVIMLMKAVMLTKKIQAMILYISRRQ